MVNHHTALVALAWAFSLSFLYLMASYSTIIPSQLNDYLGRTKYLPGKLMSWSDANTCPDTMSDMLFVLKTGGTETFKRLPVHLDTTLRCVQHSIIVSDVDVEVGNHRTIDVLADLDPETLNQPDFYLYNLQKLFHNNHGDFASLVKDKNGWNLDKYKFIPMVRRAWLAGKDRSIDWYIYIEADTAIDLGNLRRVLDELKKTQDPRTTMHYLGSENFIGKPEANFAHGGSGYVISRKGMEESVGKSPDEWVRKWGSKAGGECCGDFLLGRALKEEANLTINDARPFFQGANPTDAWYASDLWCHPVVTMHHVTPQQVAELWSMSNEGSATWNRPKAAPLLWKDVYRRFIKNLLVPMQMDWDNASSENEPLKDIKTYVECTAACEEKESCLQWYFHEGKCSIADRIRYGEAKKAKNGEKVAFSGWMIDRIDAYERDNQECTPGWKV